MKKSVVKTLHKALKEAGVKIKKEKIGDMLETPPSHELGDFAFPSYAFVEPLKVVNPHQAAIEIRQKIGNPAETDFEDIQVKGPYINFFVNRSSLAREVIWDVLNQRKSYGSSKKKKVKTMVEFPSPNTNKPLHLGHLRNMAIGESISKILEFNGEKVTRANLYNDRGLHICKSMLAYKKWGKERRPKDKKLKSDHFVGDFYVMFEKKRTKKLEREAQDMLKDWENGDKKTLMLWKLMNNWAIEGFEETFDTFGIKHDKDYFESKLYEKGKEIVQIGLEDGVFQLGKEGEVKINLKKEGLGEKVLLRKDGTSIYIVFDLALAEQKFKDYKIDRSLYVVGNEQRYHFKVLFSMLNKLGFEKKDMKHISYGMVNLPEGRMKSREGTVVDADDIIEKVRVLAEKELKKREKLSKEEMQERSLKIALAAIKYMLLKVDKDKDMLFNPKESISFEGNTGPYLLYSYARATSITKKSKKNEKYEIDEMHDSEIKLVKKLSEFPKVVEQAGHKLNPSEIANYAYDLSQIFNEFYHSCKVVGSKEEMFRLALVECFRQVLRNALGLLGIETIEKM